MDDLFQLHPEYEPRPHEWRDLWDGGHELADGDAARWLTHGLPRSMTESHAAGVAEWARQREGDHG